LELFSLLHLYSRQIEYGVPEGLVGLVEIHQIGQKKAISIFNELEGEKGPLDLEKLKKLLKNLNFKEYQLEAISKNWDPDISPVESIKKRFLHELELVRILGRIIDEDEDRDFECKQELLLFDSRGKIKLAKQIGAFANAKGGLLIIGFSDERPRKVVGIRKQDYKREKFSDVINSRISPSYDSYIFNLIKFEGKNIIVIEIEAHKLEEPLVVDEQIPYRKDGETKYISENEYSSYKSQ